MNPIKRFFLRLRYRWIGFKCRKHPAGTISVAQYYSKELMEAAKDRNLFLEMYSSDIPPRQGCGKIDFRPWHPLDRADIENSPEADEVSGLTEEE